MMPDSHLIIFSFYSNSKLLILHLVSACNFMNCSERDSIDFKLLSKVSWRSSKFLFIFFCDSAIYFSISVLLAFLWSAVATLFLLALRSNFLSKSSLSYLIFYSKSVFEFSNLELTSVLRSLIFISKFSSLDSISWHREVKTSSIFELSYWIRSRVSSFYTSIVFLWVNF